MYRIQLDMQVVTAVVRGMRPVRADYRDLDNSIIHLMNQLWPVMERCWSQSYFVEDTEFFLVPFCFGQ